MSGAAGRGARPGRGRRIALLFALVTLIPLLVTFVIFEVRPGGKPAYGELVQPQRPVPALHLQTPDGRPVDLRDLNGYWMMLVAAPAACDQQCQHLLYVMRQFDLAAGNDHARIARVWLVTDDAPLNPGVLAPAAGTVILRARPDELRRWLPGSEGDKLAGPMWLVDPLGNLMLRFPAHADPLRALSVFQKLLYNTESWKARHLAPLPVYPTASAPGAHR